MLPSAPRLPARALRRSVPVLLAFATLAGACQRSTDPVIARGNGVEVRAADLRVAVAARPDAAATRQDPARLAAIVREIAIDAALAAEARKTIPEAATRAKGVARTRAIALLLAVPQAGDDEIRSAYRVHRGDYARPAEVRLAQIQLPSCQVAAALRKEIADGTVSFAAAALRSSKDRATASRGGELGWKRLDQLGPEVQQALEAAPPKPTLLEPVQVTGGCLLVKVLELRAERTPRFAEVRGRVATRERVSRESRARREHLKKLGAAEKMTINDAALARAFTAEPGDLATPVVTVGDEVLTVGDLRTLRGGAGDPGETGRKRYATHLGEDLVLWQAARRAHLDLRPEVRAAERAALAGTLRARFDAQASPAAVSAADVAAIYKMDEGNYTEPAKVRLAALVTRDRAKAERWVKQLKEDKFPADRFDRLRAESEDTAASKPGGDVGWVDERSTHVPEAYRQAALLLTHPGAVSGVVQSAGVYHVLLCRDRAPQRVRPLAEVEGQIRALLAERRRAQAWKQRLDAVAAKLDLTIDEQALRRIRWDAP